MTATLRLRNTSTTKRLLRRDALERLAKRICAGEQVSKDVEISLLLCDDEYMSQLNHRYRKKRGPTDVLCFEQEGPSGEDARLLGDVVISLETAGRACHGDRKELRKEVDLLFCHGLLHLLGYDHATPRERKEMNRKQAEYLGITEQAAWPSEAGRNGGKGSRTGTARR